MKKLLFLCTANTCLSQMVQAIFDTLAEDKGLPFRTESAGTEAPERAVMAENAVVALEEAGDLPGAPQRTVVNAAMVEVAELCSPWIRDSPSRSTCSKGLAAGHPHPARVDDRCSGGRYTRRLRAHHGRLPKHLALAVRTCGTRGGDASGTTKSQEHGSRRVKDTSNGLTARLTPNCCLAKTAYRDHKG